VQSGGKQGDEPSAEVKKNLAALQTAQTTTNDAERSAALKQILRSQAENLWNIGTVGYPPSIRVFGNTMRNIPAGDFAQFFGDTAARPETFYFKQ
jgi:peptide/nickel transport system substrate-binding protein